MRKKIILIGRTIKLVFKSQPKLVLFCIMSKLISLLSSYPTIYFFGELLDKALVNQYEMAVKSIIHLIVYNLVLGIILSVIRKKLIIQQDLFATKQNLIMSKINMEYDFQILSSSETRDKIRLIDEIREETGFNLFSVVNLFADFISSIASLMIALISIFANLKLSSNNTTKTIVFVFAVILGLNFLIILLEIIQKKKENEFQKQSLSKYKMRWYLDREYLNFHRTGREVRIFNQHTIIAKIFNNAYFDYLKNSDKFYKKVSHYQLFNLLISLILDCVNYISIGFLAIKKIITIGHFSTFTGCLKNFSTSLLLVARSIIITNQLTVWLSLFWDYYDDCQSNTQEQISCGDFNNIEFQNVCFSYPNAEHFALNNINFEIKKGEHVAIVGMNGSGKTTLINLLCGLYKPTNGLIKYNKVPLNDYSLNSYMEKISTVFQDFKIFSFTLGQNITLNSDYESCKVRKIVQQVGLGEKFLNNTESYLFNNFGETGIEPSGGEQQKIAIARAIYKNSDLMIFDEPTASLDPISEHEIYQSINSELKEKTIVFVSHRLSSCKFCDRIIVLDKGELVQQGSHEDLLKEKSGKYWSLWNAQAKYYE